jgi:hypothetical protein
MSVEQIVKALWKGTGSANRLEMFLAMTQFSDDSTFWKVFNAVWSDCDNTWDSQGDLRDEIEWRSINGGPLSQDFLDLDQRAFLDGLKTDHRSMITVYRGCSAPRLRGMSWTSDLDVARRFAKGHRGIPVPEAAVFRAKVRKDSIFTVILDRGESEVVLSPVGLKYLQRVE